MWEILQEILREEGEGKIGECVTVYGYTNYVISQLPQFRLSFQVVFHLMRIHLCNLGVVYYTIECLTPYMIILLTRPNACKNAKL